VVASACVASCATPVLSWKFTYAIVPSPALAYVVISQCAAVSTLFGATKDPPHK
jgi:hypothetical protein